MQFNEIIGQEEVKRQLFCELQEGRMPHAQLFTGGEGVGAFATALAFATRVLCEHPQGGESCGECLSCRRIRKLQHPDLHFSFPIVRGKASIDKSDSDLYLNEFREMVLDNPYFGHRQWLKHLKAENQQMIINVAESKAIHRKLLLKSMLGGYKILIMWLPERMNETAANQLLKILEEPPAQTLFILVSEAPELLLPTIVSRTQRISFSPLFVQDIADALVQRQGINEEDANSLARIAGGNYVNALNNLTVDADNAEFLKHFIFVMRNAYIRNVKDLHKWSLESAQWGRERQKNFLGYFEHLIRENFVHNFGLPELVYETPEELDFSKKFAPFINERNVYPFMEELERAQRDIEQNVNPKMVLFDLVLKIIILIKNR